MDPKQNTSQSQKLGEGNSTSITKAIMQSCCSLIPLLIFAILFKIYTNEGHYGSELCIDLLKWSKILFYLFCCGVILFGVISPLSVCCSLVSEKNGFGACFKLLLLAIYVGYAISSFVIFIGLCVGYSEDEPCGGLRTLALVYIILVGIGLGFAVLGACCLCMSAVCFGGATLAAGLSLSAMQNNNNIQYSAVEDQNQNTN